MSKKYQRLCAYIKSDYMRYGGRVGILYFFSMYMRNHGFAFSLWLRLCRERTVFYPIAKIMHRRYMGKYGLQIPPETKIGYGLYLGHGIGILVNKTVTIGNNCNLSQFVSIGTNHGKGAMIGNNVYIGPSVCIVEDVHIGDNATIGAGSVVVKDVPLNATVAGVPAKVLNYNNPGRYIKKRYEYQNK